jgi:3-methyladenine DNA glycosylase AlkD
VRAIRLALRAAANPDKAAGMQAYMKSAMPYLGVQTPVLRAACRKIFDAHPLPDAAAWRDTVLTLWRDARYREERYAAIALTAHRSAAAFQTLDTVPLYRELIVTGAWWDYVDAIASNQIGALLRRHPAAMGKTLRAWAAGDDLWLRRTAILAQLTFKDATDLDLLYACIEPSLDRREFFLRKGIGWALRQYARVDAREVLRYVTAHADRLSPLSRREALKAQLAAGILTSVP